MRHACAVSNARPRPLLTLRHPHIVRAIDRGEAEGFRFLVMDLVEGVSLRARLAEGPLPLSCTCGTPCRWLPPWQRPTRPASSTAI